MDIKQTVSIGLAALVLAIATSGVPAFAEEFDEMDIEHWQEEYMAVVKKGDNFFHGGLGNDNTVSCDQCHPNGANVHPETYPKFQQQIGRVVVLGEMINWCIMNPLESEAIPLDDPAMVALQAYIHHERRGVALVPGKH